MDQEHSSRWAVTASGRSFTEEEICAIVRMVSMCAGLSRFELAQTVCELLEWRRDNGALKARECRDLLERLEARGDLRLPAKRPGRPKGRRTCTAQTDRGECRGEIAGALPEVAPVELDRVRDAEGRALWRELLARYHYLGYATPFGAQLVYLIRSERREGEVLGGLTYTSPAWRMQARDAWIGWDETARKAHLARIVNQGRFLILPWVKVPHLASHVLALGSRRIVGDWEKDYGVRPWLLETLVDPARFAGTCYRAANWYEVGETSGRGRMDREHRRHGRAIKRVFLYPLHPAARERLRGEC
jgi:hypothetical protein